MYIFSIIHRSISLFSRKQRLFFILLMIFFLFSALVQVVGLASIGPFIALLSNTSAIETNKVLYFFYNYFSFTSTRNFIVGVAFGSLIMTILSNFTSILTLWLLIRFTIVIGADIQRRLFENLMFRPYLFHKSNNYSEAISLISQQAPRFVYMVMQSILLLFSNLFVALVILAGLVYLSPVTVLITGFLLGITYLLTYMFLKKALKRHGDALSERNNLVQKILSEAFIGIKEVILSRLQKIFVDNFRTVNLKGLYSTSFISLSGDIPKFIIETVAFSVIFISAIIILLTNQNTQSIVPFLSIYAIAGYKLIPTMHQIYKSVSALSAHGSVSFSLYDELHQESHIDYRACQSEIDSVLTIQLENVYFKYPNAQKTTLENINVSFHHNMINTIAGHSGSGKSTLVDVLLGLLKPDSGRILIDNELADKESVIQLQRSAGYVPQQIFILDDTVISNVAFGVKGHLVNKNEVIRSLKQANAMNFVENLPQGIHTRLGQDGKLLSGGQRQKIGIARSLYRNPKILILDEPTSALDIESEYDFMMLLRKLKTQALIIVISHRPSALKYSDRITLMQNGKIESHGTFQQLKEISPVFINILDKCALE